MDIDLIINSYNKDRYKFESTGKARCYQVFSNFLQTNLIYHYTQKYKYKRCMELFYIERMSNKGRMVIDGIIRPNERLILPFDDNPVTTLKQRPKQKITLNKPSRRFARNNTKDISAEMNKRLENRYKRH